MNESIQSRFAFRLKEMRENRNLSQAALSKRLSISQSTVASWEVGTREPSLQHIENVADFFGVTVDYLFVRTDIPLTVYKTDTPYLEVTPFEKTIVEAYRGLSTAEQVIVCRSLGLMHPAESRAKANQA